MTGTAEAAGVAGKSGATGAVTVSDRSPVRVGQARGMCLVGVDGVPVTVECDISRGLPGMSIGGLGDTAVNQARDRVRSAMINSGLAWPKSRVVMSLSPAALPKSGSGFDLPMVLAVLSAQGMVADGAPGADPTATVVIGELGLTGEVRPVPGVLPMLLAARGAGAVRAAVPAGNAAEAARVDGMDITGLDHLDQLLPWVHEELDAPVADLVGAEGDQVAATPSRVPDLSEVSGQSAARRALEVAAAGGHHLWLTGPPGSGKSMLAERLPGILPPLTDTERTETAAVHSVAAEQGNLPAVWSGRRPFVTPHPSLTLPALTGGGAGRVRPGAASLAHHGVLFLDEAPEIRREVLEGLRTPMENGRIALSRARGTVVLPARFQLVLASNPCPCGAPEPADCRCRGGVRDRYLQRISGPVRDRLDLTARTTTDRSAVLDTGGGVEDSATVRDRVLSARDRGRHRWQAVNALVDGPALRRDHPAQDAAMLLLQEHLRAGGLTHRGVDRSLRVAWTLADLAGVGQPGIGEVMDAVELFTAEIDGGRS